MTADHRGDPGQQRTVAELLKQYGGEEASSGRRRRRAADQDPAPSTPPRPRGEEPSGAPGTDDVEPAGGYPEMGTGGFTATGGFPRVGERNGSGNGSGEYSAGGTGGYRATPSGAFETYESGTSGFDRVGGTGGFDPAGGTGGFDPVSGTGGFDPAGGLSGFDRPAAGGFAGGGTPGGGFDGGGFDGGYGAREPSAFDPASGTGWSGEPDSGPPTLSGTGSFSVPAYRGDIYQGGGPPTSPGLIGAPREESTDFIPRYGKPGAPPPRRPGGVEDSGPGTAVSSRAEMFDDDLDEAGPSRQVSSRAAFFDDDEDDDDGPSTSVRSRAELFDDEDEDEDQDERDSDEYDELDDAEESRRPSGFLGRRMRRGRASEPSATEDADPLDDDEPADLFQKQPAASDDVPAGLSVEDDADEVEHEGEPSNAKVWLSLIGQWILGAISGAALWIGFRFLWLNYPVVALAAAVLATAGLVLLVRAIRRSDDLQTTMLAVLVGLVVTISPAVLLLANR